MDLECGLEDMLEMQCDMRPLKVPRIGCLEKKPY